LAQTPIPTVADTIRLEVPLPDAVERWRQLYTETAFEALFVFLAFAVFFYFAARLARRAVRENIEDVNRRHILKKWISYTYAALLFLLAVALFADWLTGLGTILALLLAGIAVALQDVLKSFVGWLYLSSRSGVEIGSRVEVHGVVGDVIDIGVLKTTMLEVGGNLVFGRQSTGRLVTVPNYRMLSEAVLISASSSPYVWQEMQLTVTFDSDWRRAEEILNEVGNAIHEEIAPELEQGFRKLERRYAFKYGMLTPIVYVSIGPSGVELTLRFLVHVRRRRGAIDHASRRILAEIAAEPTIRVAYTAFRIHSSDAEARGGRPHPVADEGARGLGPEEGMVTD
jgi:small-conductance mechanosensitive channel